MFCRTSLLLESQQSKKGKKRYNEDAKRIPMIHFAGYATWRNMAQPEAGRTWRLCHWKQRKTAVISNVCIVENKKEKAAIFFMHPRYTVVYTSGQPSSWQKYISREPRVYRPRCHASPRVHNKSIAIDLLVYKFACTRSH